MCGISEKGKCVFKERNKGSVGFVGSFNRQNQSTVEKENIISSSEQIIENANYDQIFPSKSVNNATNDINKLLKPLRITLE